MGTLLVVLRVGALVLAGVGSMSSVLLAAIWQAEFEKRKQEIGIALYLLDGVEEGERPPPSDPKQAQALAEARAAYHKLGRAVRATRFLYAGAVLGLLGGLLAALGRTGCGAALLLVAAAGPAVLVPFTLVFTSPLVAAGLVALGATVLALFASSSRLRDRHPPPDPVA
jgi:hypothetical protein